MTSTAKDWAVGGPGEGKSAPEPTPTPVAFQGASRAQNVTPPPLPVASSGPAKSASTQEMP